MPSILAKAYTAILAHQLLTLGFALPQFDRPATSRVSQNDNESSTSAWMTRDRWIVLGVVLCQSGLEAAEL